MNDKYNAEHLELVDLRINLDFDIGHLKLRSKGQMPNESRNQGMANDDEE